MSPPDLPVLSVLPALRAALSDTGAAVLVAPPGTGKTTGVPPALLDEPWAAHGRIVMLEPRRVAARAAAARMAATHGEQVGHTYGYAVRHDRKVGRSTRVEVVTEGLLTRRLQSDPALDGVSAVLLDEFHERSVDVDLALALLLEVRGSLRPDLRLLVMSATLDAAPVAALLGDATGGTGGPPAADASGTSGAAVVAAEAPIHPVDTRYRPGSAHDRLEDRVAAVVVEALGADSGDLLVFLPGRGEIARTAERLGGRVGPAVDVHELHGSVPPAEQDRILSPGPAGRRRVILATSIAETSVTVPGVRVVVDSGRRRTQHVDPRSGLPALVTGPVSRAGADQRRGRAGREAPGVCYRLWSEADDRHRDAHDPPEILGADLAPLVLQTLSWGAGSPDELRWLDPPPDHAVARATALLGDLDAVAAGRLTATGRELSTLGMHPRLGAIAVAGRELGVPGLAAELAAVLEVGGPGDRELTERVRALRAGRAPAEVARVARQRRRGSGRDALALDDDALDRMVGRLALAGFADRLARRRPGRRDGRGRERAVYLLRHGGEVELERTDGPLAGHDWLVVTDLDARTGSGRPGRVYVGVGVHPDDLRPVLDHHATEECTAVWDHDAGTIVATRRIRLDAITVSSRPWRDPDREAVATAIAAAVRERGPALLARWPEADRLRARVAFVAAHGIPCPPDPARPTAEPAWPDLSEAHLTATAGEWLAPLLHGVRSAAKLSRVDVASAIRALLPWAAQQALDREAPTEWRAPTGRTFPLAYGAVDGDPASVLLSARLHDLLGVDVHPTVTTRRVPVTVELLSPARRPVQRTTDLPGFWRGSYSQVRAELRAKYRKHDWPERPWESG